jgi:BirA family biotin operon repressor/biotin-[acetyl-CoA-carboxylase] ligase
MNNLEANEILNFVVDSNRESISDIEVFGEIQSTNSYLMNTSSPSLKKMCIAVTTNQTAGRGRYGKTWYSPFGTGLCLSASYTFSKKPSNLAALTLAIGVSIAEALHELKISNIELKWPNDLVIQNSKLGGILTEIQYENSKTISVVTGIGLNVNFPDRFVIDIDKDWAQKAIDLKSICNKLPCNNKLVGTFANHLLKTFNDFETSGFDTFSNRWSERDWLFGKKIKVNTKNKQYLGIGAGIANDGSLLIETVDHGICRLASGTIVEAEA